MYRGYVKKRDDASGHRFKVGETVFYTSGVGSSRRSDVFTIMQRLPAEGGNYQYRIKSADEPFDRVSKKANSKRRCDLHGFRLQLTCRVVYAKA